MKKKESDTNKTLNHNKVMGAKNESLSQASNTSAIVGGIVEKGFSQNTPLAPSSFPRATVLPFPVARHRSHGPHWAPKVSDNSGNLNDDDEEDDCDNGQAMAAFAEPVRRKQKKTVNISRWRELITDDSGIHSNKRSNKLIGTSQQQNVTSDATGVVKDVIRSAGVGKNVGQIEGRLLGDDMKDQAVDMEFDGFTKKGMEVEHENVSDIITDDVPSNMLIEQANYRDEAEAHLDNQYMSESLMALGQGFDHMGNEQDAVSLGSQIDAENHARLQKMSAADIAEAKAELNKKLNSSLLEKLKKRGQNKSKLRHSGSQVEKGQNEKVLTNKSTFTQNEKPHAVTKTDSPQTLADKGLQVNNYSGGPWDTWTKRVEAVRELRFDLDGNVINAAGNKIGYSAGNVTERDLLRTDGDPAGAGYTIKEAIALTRSMVPGQRVLALHMLASVLNRASDCVLQNLVGSTMKCSTTDILHDWEAIWSFILGPEPQLAFCLRMSLDDNNDSVVLACAKVIQSALCSDINESFFDMSEKTVTYQKGVCTAPVFRSRPKIENSFLKGGLWKYNTKPSNLLPFDDDAMDDKPEGATIQDDLVVAEQDFAAGLARMGILSRIRYLLEMDPSAVLEERIISILIAIARHSPACADAIMNCQRLVQTVVNRFNMTDQMEINFFKIKAVKLVKVLAQSEKNCLEFIKNGTFQKMTWQLYRYTSSIDDWVKSGRENCQNSSDLLVEQLRFWKVCIQYGHCVSNLTDLLPSLCIWLDVPTFENMIVNNILDEFTAIAKEAYLVLEVLTRRLPNFYSEVESEEVASEDKETWCWSHVGPIVELALKWIAIKSNPYLSRCFDWKNANRSNFDMKGQAGKSLLWVISSVMHMLSSLLEKVIPEDTYSLHGGHVPWLPDFVPKIGLQMIKQEIFSFTGATDKDYSKDPSRGGSFLEYLCHLRNESDREMSIASVVCLQGSLQVVVSVDKLIRLANMHTTPSQGFSFSKEDKILAGGILKSSLVNIEKMLIMFMNLIASEWQCMQSVEIFGRGGPAPGVGVGWGASGGGFWSTAVLLAQMDATLLMYLLDRFPVVCSEDQPNSEDTRFTMQRINCGLHMCLIAGPNDRFLMDKLLEYLFQIPVLKCLNLCIKNCKEIGWQYQEEDYQLISDNLRTHFKSRWLYIKKKSQAERNNSQSDHKTSTIRKVNLETIHEVDDTSNMTSQRYNSNSLVVEWAHQRLPLPSHWFLSPLSTYIDSKSSEFSTVSNSPNCKVNADLLGVVKGGLFYLLGIEAMSTFFSCDYPSSVQCVPLSWKLHSLSASLYDNMGVLEDKSRDLFENLQEVYGQLLQSGEINSLELLRFQSDIHESYSAFIETLVEQFAAVSYGDMIYGRQIAIYLHRCVEAPVRLAAWNSLSNARVLELLPPIEKCVGKVEGYLEPAEDNEKILEAYVKSWTSGALDRAVGRGSVAFTLVMHHVASFIFSSTAGDKVTLRNRLIKSLLRDYSGKKQHQSMMMDLIQYNKPSYCQHGKELKVPQLYSFDKRFELLKNACEGSTSLLSEVDKLELSCRK